MSRVQRIALGLIALSSTLISCDEIATSTAPAAQAAMGAQSEAPAAPATPAARTVPATPDPALAASGAEGYVGRSACVECHAPETDRWLGSHHDLAMQEVDETTVLGDFDDATFTHFGVTSTFFRRDGRPMVRTDGPDGRMADYEVAYVFGVAPLQQYLVRFPGGRLQTLGLCWDARPAEQGGQRWYHLYGDERITHEDPLHWTRRSQTWNLMCADCHSTNLRPGYSAADRTYETTYSEIDVSCEACHGPCAEHVDWARALPEGVELPPDADTRLQVTLATLSADPEEGGWVFDEGQPTARWDAPPRARDEREVCSACHSRRGPLRDSVVAGRPLLDSYRPALLTEPLYHADGQIDDEVYVYGSFLQSRMHAAGVTCSDCHDPHKLGVYIDGNALCARCHDAEHFDRPEHHFHEQGTTSARCVECHMPSKVYMGVDARRDHSLRIPRPDLTVELGTPNACNACHLDKTPQWAAKWVVDWYGEEAGERPHYGRALAAGRAGAPGAEAVLAALAEDAEQPGIVRATALELLGGLLTPASLPAVERGLEDDDPLVRLAAVGATDALPLAMRAGYLAPLLDDELLAVRSEAGFGLAGMRGRQNFPGLERALDEYRAAQEARADWPESHLNLGLAHAVAGEFEQAVEAYREALALDPAFIPASVNLADVRRAQGRDDLARQVLEQALALTDGSGMLHHALGLTLVRSEGAEVALPELARAAELDPGQPRFAYVYGVALHGLGRTEQALGVLADAAARHEGDRDLLLALASVQRDAGRLDAALASARRLEALEPGSPAATQLIAELEAASR